MTAATWIVLKQTFPTQCPKHNVCDDPLLRMPGGVYKDNDPAAVGQCWEVIDPNLEWNADDFRSRTDR